MREKLAEQLLKNCRSTCELTPSYLSSGSRLILKSVPQRAQQVCVEAGWASHGHTLQAAQYVVAVDLKLGGVFFHSVCHLKSDAHLSLCAYLAAHPIEGADGT